MLHRQSSLIAGTVQLSMTLLGWAREGVRGKMVCEWHPTCRKSLAVMGLEDVSGELIEATEWNNARVAHFNIHLKMVAG